MYVDKKNSGGAYIMILTFSMLILLLVSLALSLTAVSRRLTSYYARNTGLYDLAVAGNEQIYLFLNQALIHNRDDIEGPEDARNVVLNELQTTFTRFIEILNTGEQRILYRHSWGLAVSFDLDELVIQDTYNAITTIRPTGQGFTVRTHIQMGASVPMIVEAYLKWPTTTNHLDDYMLRMVESRRILDLAQRQG